ncbi:hypothetical protein CGC20_32730 [Leishmania donovani]|uniref:Uncharacterized protein n=1 Tax=Leishmania donovani TaxID=5661 RepID=A0A504XEP7_LEIDO|nr:hypothetical protein CGC20_32730 [Leishmania donovani]TPP47522.1 hypothetical protein CGC21_30820 [Leishmania donovani]
MTHGALNAVSGFLSTISSRSAQSRRTHRPCIPYVLVAMTHHLPEMDILFGGAVTPSALTMNDEGGKFVAQRGTRTRSRPLEEQTVLCRDAQKWCRDALLKVCRTRSNSVQAAPQQADFNAYGRCLHLNELRRGVILE